MSVFLDLSYVNNSATHTVDLSAEGTIDWFWCCDQGATAIPYDLGYNVLNRKKGAPGYLVRGFAWRVNASVSSIIQAVQRTLTASAEDNITGFAVSSNSKTGFFQLTGSALYGVGYRLVIPAPVNETWRLRCYSTDYRSNLTGTAKVMDGETEEASQVVGVSGVNGNSIHEWQVDFRGGTTRSMMIFEMIIASAVIGADQNLGIQGFSLSRVP